MQWIKQGDALYLTAEITLEGEKVDVQDIETAEFRLGRLRKLYPGEVEYDGEEGLFRIPLSQEETLAFPPGTAVPADLRVKFNGGRCV